ncbi:MAG: hypothetical protein DRQ41_15160 [Gammaproteobacteria bacterium]|nr:MAG: hypothetical protein DRQ41_15160 [Gammaproteobacteria bacterium]
MSQFLWIEDFQSDGENVVSSFTENDIPFSQFCSKKNRQNVTAQNMRDYLETLQNFLPRREPDDAKQLYKLFVRTLSHEWEDDFSPDNLQESKFSDKNTFKRQKMFGSIIKCTRNWTAHTQIFDKLCERDVAFLFIVAMRAMFKLSDKTERYENLLLQLTDKLPKQELKTLKIFFEYEYDFGLNGYGKDDMDSFLFELARSIYKRSFTVMIKAFNAN